MSATKRQLVHYVWTDQDQQIANGNAAGSAQGPYLTPYGIPAAAMPDCKTRVPGTAYDDINLGLSNMGEPWRAQRFHADWEADSFHLGSTRPHIEWKELSTLPSGIDESSTLAQLCDALRTQHADVYPLEIYDPARIATSPNDGYNTARALFDYWGNSEYRYAVVKAGFDWSTYLNDPGSIPISAGGVRIKMLPRMVTMLETIVAGPNVFNAAFTEDTAQKIEWYMSNLRLHTLRIYNILDAARQAAEERFKTIQRLYSAKAVADASAMLKELRSQYAAPQAVATDWAKVSAALDPVIKSATDALLTKPLTAAIYDVRPEETVSADLERVAIWTNIPAAAQRHTADVATALQVERTELFGLVHESGYHAELIKTLLGGMKPYLGGLGTGSTRAEQLATQLTGALANAAEAIEAAGSEDRVPELVKRYIDELPENPILPENISEKSPAAVMLKGLGKVPSLVKYDNGLRVAMATADARYAIGRLATEAAERWEKVAFGAAMNPVELSTFRDAVIASAKRTAKLLPSGTLHDEIEAAAESLNHEIVAAKADAFAEAVGKTKKGGKGGEGALELLNILCFAISVANAAEKDPVSDRVQVVTLMLSGSKMVVNVGKYGSSLLSTMKVTSAFGKGIVKGATWAKTVLSAAGTALDIAAGFLGIVTGAVAVVEAWEQGDVLGVTAGALTTVGSGCGIMVALAGGGAVVPILNVVAGACALAGISVTLLKAAFEAVVTIAQEGTLAKRLVTDILKAVSSDPLWKYCEITDPGCKSAMTAVTDLCGSGELPNGDYTREGAVLLGKAGFQADMVSRILRPHDPAYPDWTGRPGQRW